MIPSVFAELVPNDEYREREHTTPEERSCPTGKGHHRSTCAARERISSIEKKTPYSEHLKQGIHQFQFWFQPWYSVVKVYEFRKSISFGFGFWFQFCYFVVKVHEYIKSIGFSFGFLFQFFYSVSKICKCIEIHQFQFCYYVLKVHKCIEIHQFQFFVSVLFCRKVYLEIHCTEHLYWLVKICIWNSLNLENNEIQRDYICISAWS